MFRRNYKTCMMHYIFKSKVKRGKNVFPVRTLFNFSYNQCTVQLRNKSKSIKTTTEVLYRLRLWRCWGAVTCYRDSRVARCRRRSRTGAGCVSCGWTGPTPRPCEPPTSPVTRCDLQQRTNTGTSLMHSQRRTQCDANGTFWWSIVYKGSQKDDLRHNEMAKVDVVILFCLLKTFLLT